MLGAVSAPPGALRSEVSLGAKILAWFVTNAGHRHDPEAIPARPILSAILFAKGNSRSVAGAGADQKGGDLPLLLILAGVLDGAWLPSLQSVCSSSGGAGGQLHAGQEVAQPGAESGGISPSPSPACNSKGRPYWAAFAVAGSIFQA